MKRLRDRATLLRRRRDLHEFFRGFREPWLYHDAEGAAATLTRAGFVDVETSVEAAPTVLQDAAPINEFVRNIILRRHLQNLPTEELRSEFMEQLDRAGCGRRSGVLPGLLASEFARTRRLINAAHAPFASLRSRGGRMRHPYTR